MENLFSNLRIYFKKVNFDCLTKEEINKAKGDNIEINIKNDNFNCYGLKLGKIGCIDTDNAEAEQFVNNIIGKEYIKTPSISNILLKGQYQDNYHRLFIIPDELKDNNNNYKVGDGSLDILFKGWLYEPKNNILTEDYLIPTLSISKYNELMKFKPTIKTRTTNNFYNKKDDFELLENKFNPLTLAELYFNDNKDKYIYNVNLGWFSYDKFNKLISWGKNTPIGIINDIQEYLNKFIDNHKPTINLKVDKEVFNIELKRIKIINKCYNTVADPNTIEKIIKILIGKYNNNELELNPNRNIIAFDDKIYDFEKGEFRDIQKNDYITVSTKYMAPNKQDKEILKELDELLISIFNNDILKNYYLVTTALSLYNNNKEECFFHNGGGGNGKGVLSSLLSNCLGSYFLTVENTFLTSFTKAGSANSSLYSSKFVKYLFVSEPDNGDNNILNCDFLKSLTGADTVSCRQLYGTQTGFKPRFIINMQCNTMPDLKKLDCGLIRRIRTIPYLNKFVEKPTKPNERLINYKLKEKLNKQEYINNFMLLLLNKATEYINKPIEIPKEVEQATADYFEDNNPIKVFIDEYYNINIENNYVKISDIKKLYEAITEKKIDSKRISNDLKLNNFIVIKKNGQIVCEGLQLKDNF